VADATVRAVNAIETSPASPTGNGSPAEKVKAVSAALHQAVVDRVVDAKAGSSDASAQSSVTTLPADGLVSGMSPDAKPHATPSHHALRGGDSPLAQLPDGLPRHAASALRAAAGFDRPIRIRLSPGELGSLQVEVSRHEGAVAARFEVTSFAAQSVLNDHLPALRESLGRAGVTIDRIEVRLADGASDDGRAEGQAYRDNPGGGHGQQQRDWHDEVFHETQDEVAPQRRSVANRAATPQSQKVSRGAAADLIDIQV
jgi:flagellar hook-length control protein FliK